MWEPIEIVTCDLCNRAARFRHTLGGVRCDKCPKPEEGIEEICGDRWGHYTCCLPARHLIERGHENRNGYTW